MLSRTLGDSAAVTSPLIPWNSCGAYMAATLGVATTSYVPFAFFNLINPLVSIAFAFLGLRMLRTAEAETDVDPTDRDGRPTLNAKEQPHVPGRFDPDPHRLRRARRAGRRRTRRWRSRRAPPTSTG